MKENPQITRSDTSRLKPAPANAVALRPLTSTLTPLPSETPPVREPDIKPTPKAQAKAANKLPRTEQLEKFEQHLEAHDPGNQPA